MRLGGGAVPVQSLEAVDTLATLLQASPDAVIAVNGDGIIVFASAAVDVLFGYKPGKLVGQAVEMLVPDEFRSVHKLHLAHYAKSATARPMGLGLELTGRRRNGSVFPIDVALSPVSVAGDLLIGAYVRDATERRRHEARLRAINEITQGLLAGEPPEVTLGLVARIARGLVDGALGWVVVPTGKGDLEIIASDGAGSDSVIGVEIKADSSISMRAMTDKLTILVDDVSADAAVPGEVQALGLGPGLYCPLSGEDRVFGALVIARASGEPTFSASDTASVEVFAKAATVALTLAEARLELDQLQAAAEHERIGRDLHDTVIQRLFALGMSLQSIERLATGPVAERIDRVVDGLDEVIRDIRETIFHLERPSIAGSGLRQAISKVAQAASEQLGFSPRLAFEGPVDSVTSDQLQPHVVAVVTEALSNVARHAEASSVEVVVAAEADTLVVSVADDGVGLRGGRTAGNGLRNIAERARSLSGSVSVSARNPSGTLVEWRVPFGP